MNDDDDHPRAVYKIRVQGELDAGWEYWFDGLAVMVDGSGEGAATTTLVGPVADQAALRGMLCKLWDLNLILISVRRIEAANKGEQENE